MSTNNSYRKRSANRDYVIDSDEEEDNDYDESDDDNEDRKKKKKNDNNDDDASSSSDTDEETVDAKRIRLAREYLNKIKKGEDEEEDSSSSDEDDDDDDDDVDHIGRKLAKDRLVQEGAYDIKVADKIECDADTNKISYWSRNAHDLSPTCIDLHSSGQWAYSGSKDHSVVMWDVERGCVNGVVLPQWKNKKRWAGIHYNEDKNEDDDDVEPRNNGEVLAVASSDDGRYLATGGRDALVKIFDVRLVDKIGSKNALIHTFRGHKEAITSLAFRNQTLQLFSGSNDRTIRHYNLEQNSFIETLYGHQQAVTALSCHRKDTPISTSRDRTVRAWKLTQETHFIYRGGKAMPAADCISVVNNDWFVTGHENGCVHLWSQDRKKPVGKEWHCGRNAKGKEIVSCNVWKGSDFGITGSYDGFLKLWKLRTGQRSSERGIDSIGSVAVPGYINGIAIGPKAKFCVVAVGQEHRLGRWNRVKGAKNRIGIIPLRTNDDEN